MSDRIDVVVVGLGGYGEFYLRSMLEGDAAPHVRIVGAVDPAPERCSRLAELKEAGVPVYDSLGDFYAEGSAELAVLSSPIQWHCPQTCLALEHGTNVLCEKPLAAAVQDADQMIAAREAAGRFVAIGYQWSFSPPIQALKADIMAGRYGAPLWMKCMTLWPRDEAYYNRNKWAAHIKDSAGHWVLDSPVNNAVAHYLHNMFYLLGPRVDRSAMPISVAGELYRANPIQNYDTAALRARTDCGAEVMFFATHACEYLVGPVFSARFERGRAVFTNADGRLRGITDDGEVVDYGNPNRNGDRKLLDALAAVRGEGGIACGIEAARAQTLCMNGLQEASPIGAFPEGAVRVEGEPGSRRTWVKGLVEQWVHCYSERRLPSELGIDWAQPAGEADLAGYTEFPSELSTS